jgi:hypothetical protein
MDASAKKAFQVKVRCLVRTLKEYKAYRKEVQAYDLNLVSQDKKQQEFYLESKSALEQVEKKLVEYYHQLNAYLVCSAIFRAKTKQRSRRKNLSKTISILLKRISRKSRNCSQGLADLIPLILILSH